MSEKCISCEAKGPEWLKELNRLVAEHPDAQVVHMVAVEEFTDDFYRMATDNVSVELTQYMLRDSGEMVTDEEDIKEDIAEALFDEFPDSKEWSDENVEIHVDQLYEEFIKKNPWTKAIYVNIG